MSVSQAATKFIHKRWQRWCLQVAPLVKFLRTARGKIISFVITWIPGKPSYCCLNRKHLRTWRGGKAEAVDGATFKDECCCWASTRSGIPPRSRQVTQKWGAFKWSSDASSLIRESICVCVWVYLCHLCEGLAVGIPRAFGKLTDANSFSNSFKAVYMRHRIQSGSSELQNFALYHSHRRICTETHTHTGLFWNFSTRLHPQCAQSVVHLWWNLSGSHAGVEIPPAWSTGLTLIIHIHTSYLSAPPGLTVEALSVSGESVAVPPQTSRACVELQAAVGSVPSPKCHSFMV